MTSRSRSQKISTSDRSVDSRCLMMLSTMSRRRNCSAFWFRPTIVSACLMMSHDSDTSSLLSKLNVFFEPSRLTCQADMIGMSRAQAALRISLPMAL